MVFSSSPYLSRQQQIETNLGSPTCVKLLLQLIICNLLRSQVGNKVATDEVLLINFSSKGLKKYRQSVSFVNHMWSTQIKRLKSPKIKNYNFKLSNLKFLQTYIFSCKLRFSVLRKLYKIFLKLFFNYFSLFFCLCS